MKIYTGYFAKVAQYPHPISIARYKPKWLGGIPEYIQLAPSGKLLGWYKDAIRDAKNSLEIEKINDKYKVQFTYENLLPVGAEKIYNWLENLANRDPEITLLCYEKSGDFCHRYIVTEFLQQAGYEIGGEYVRT